MIVGIPATPWVTYGMLVAYPATNRRPSLKTHYRVEQSSSLGLLSAPCRSFNMVGRNRSDLSLGKGESLFSRTPGILNSTVARVYRKIDMHYRLLCSFFAPQTHFRHLCSTISSHNAGRRASGPLRPKMTLLFCRKHSLNSLHKA